MLDDSSRNSKRGNNDTNPKLQADLSPRLRRHMRHSKGSSTSSTSTSSADVLVSSLTKRLNQMSVKERQNAMYDLHGIPLDDEYYDVEGVRGNTIERDPQKLHKLLLELDRLVEERIIVSKTSYAEGENFGEPQLFPLLVSGQQQELMMPPKKEAVPPIRIYHDGRTQDMEYSHIPAAAGGECIEQRVQFLKHHLDDKEFGKGLQLAKKQNPEYVHAQRIKFLRADRYDVNLASARMIRFFDTKRELFCAPGYNKINTTDLTGCLGRDLRLSDFSKEDFEIWKKTGFIQLCGMRDRAKRAIVVLFGKVITEANIPIALVMRVYLYVINLWSRDESTQRAGIVVIGYSMFTDASSWRNNASASDIVASTTKSGEVGTDGRKAENIGYEEAVDRYLKQTYPLLSQMVKVGMSGQLRSVSKHFCYDHPKLNAQFEKLAGYMSTFSAARLRCHFVNPDNPESYILRATGSSKYKSTGSSLNNDSAPSDHDAKTVDFQTQPRQKENDNKTSNTSDVNPYKELLYTLMTFGIPRETIPINDLTGEISLEFHQAILVSIEERERQDRLLEAAAVPSANAAEPNANSKEATGVKRWSGDKSAMSLTSSTGSNKLWMSLTASTGSNTSFALFPNLLDDEELDDKSDHETSSLFGSLTIPPNEPFAETNEGQPKAESLSPDLPSSSSIPLASSSVDNVGSLTKSNTTTNDDTSENPKQVEAASSNPADMIFTPTPNDVIMGRGPWNRNHPGNLRLKAMLERERDRYEYVNRFERMRVVDGMLTELYEDYGARFLYKPKSKLLSEMQTDDTDLPVQPPTSTEGDMWLEAKRDKAHDKITHDFRNLRRQKQASPKPN